jgi:hypothetical protein
MSSPVSFTLRLCTCVLAVAICAPALLAQKPAAAPPAPSQSLLFFVMPFPGSDRLTEEQYAKLPSVLPFSQLTQGKPVELVLPVGGLAEPLVRPAQADFSLRRHLAKKPGPTDQKSPEPAELATVRFPAAWKSVLILVSAPTDASSAKLIAYDVSETVLPTSQFGVYNLTGQSFAARLGSAQTMIRPQGLTLLPIQLPPGRNNASLELNIASRSPQGDWQIAARQSLVLGKLKRRLAFVSEGPGENPVVNLLHFRLPLDPAPAPPAP